MSLLIVMNGVTCDAMGRQRQRDDSSHFWIVFSSNRGKQMEFLHLQPDSRAAGAQGATTDHRNALHSFHGITFGNEVMEKKN